MSLRTIMIFPEFENMEIIDRIRRKYDPLAELVRPHITLVFPFENKLSNSELTEILNKRLYAVRSFELRLGRISKQEDETGYYLFLNVIQDVKEINNIHKLLYEKEFKEYDSGVSYIPHMTIGKLPSAEKLDDAFNMVKSVNDTFFTVVRKIAVEMIGDNEESIVVIEKQLE